MTQAPLYAGLFGTAEEVVTKIASWQPRTQSGSATWAGTLRLAKTTIQDAPACSLA